MNIVFIGSAHFSVPTFEALIASGHTISCAVTQPDKQKGRGLHMASTPVKLTAEQFSIPVYQPVRINTSPARDRINALKPDIIVVIAYGQILSSEILQIPKLLAINAHASLLPYYRGAAPINWALIKGENVTGVSVIKVIKEMDAGPIIARKEMPIMHDDNAVTLEEKLSKLAAELIVDSVKNIELNRITFAEQESSQVSFAPKLKKKDGLIDWNKPALQIHNLVRGCVVWPGAYTCFHDKYLKLIKTSAALEHTPNCAACHPGEIIEITKERIIVGTGTGYLSIEELQIEGKRRMTSSEFISGHSLKIGDKFIPIKC